MSKRLLTMRNWHGLSQVVRLSGMAVLKGDLVKDREEFSGSIRIMVSALAIVQLGDCLTEPLSFFCTNKNDNLVKSQNSRISIS